MTAGALRWAGEMAGVLILAAVPVAGYGALYGNSRYLVTLGAALLAGTVAAGLAVLGLTRLGPGVDTATRFARTAAVLTFVAVGALGWLPARPRPAAGNPVSEIAHGLSAILTLNQPVDLANDVLAIPFLVTFAATGLGLLALGSGSLLLPLLPAALALTVQLLLCAGYSGPVGVSSGIAVFAATSVLLIGFRRRRQTGTGSASAGPETLRLAGTAVAVALVTAATAAAVLGPNRFDPRDRWLAVDVEPQVTPLAFVRSDLNGPDEPRFSISVTGAARPALVVLARLDVFDGTAWSARPRFRVAGTVLRPDRGSGGSTSATRADVDVVRLPANLLPQLGWPVRLQRQPAIARRGSVLLDRDSGMILARSAPASWRYTLTGDAAEPEAATPTAARCRAHADDPSVVELRHTWLPQRPVTAAALTDLAARMRSQLPYNPQAPAGSSLAAIERVLSGSGPGRVGYAEQHAAAFSYLACAAGLPARVVVGYRLPGPPAPGVVTRVSAHDAHAWSEVYVAGTGWLTFDPTDPDKPVTALAGGATTSTTDAGASPPPAVAGGTTTSTSGSGGARSWSQLSARLASALRAAVVPVLLVLIVLITAGLLFLLGYRMLVAARRRRDRAARRRMLLQRRYSPDPRERVMGAWTATTQLCRERGLPVRASSTPEQVAAIARAGLADPGGCMPQLVTLVNAALFGPYPPTETEAERAWVLADELLTAPARPVTALVGAS